MPIAASELDLRLRTAFPDAEVTITDLAGDGDHYRARIVSDAFTNVSRVRRHQLVNRALADILGGVLHALALETVAPGE